MIFIQKLHTHSGSNNSDMHHPNAIYKAIGKILIYLFDLFKKKKSSRKFYQIIVLWFLFFEVLFDGQ